MSLRTISVGLVAWFAFACGGDPHRSDDPTTAKEKQSRETAAAGEPHSSGKWSGWRYTGDREACFFVVGRRCFKTEAAACAAARCGSRACETSGAGPASVVCAK